MDKRWTAGSTSELLGVLDEHEVETVHAGLFDLDGVFREKRLPLAQFREFARAGWSFIDALPYWGPNDTTRADRAWRHEACAFDVASVRPYPFEPRAALVVADYSGPSRALSPRVLLAQQLARAHAAGYVVHGASEFECIILDESPASLTQKDYAGLVTHAQHNRCWSGTWPASDADFVRDYLACLALGDMPLHHVCAELGPGCLEAALPRRPLAVAADDAALFKLYTKAFCTGRGLTASFMAQLSDEHPGLGGHPILSLHDAASGRSLFHDRKRTHALSKLALQFIAGVLNLAPELMALFAGTVNAYRRYAPGNWAPRTATWGVGNYTCGLRIVSDDAQGTRLEFRLPGADMNPHLAFAMLLGAGLTGIERQLAPLPATDEVARDFVHARIGPLPRSLLEAAERLHASRTARELFGDAFVDHYAQSRMDEDASLRRHVSAFERRRYLHHV